MGAFPQPRFIATLRRFVAAGSSVLVFALCLFAASPLLHRQLHAGLDSVGDDHCAVVLFANGVSAPAAVAAPPPPVADWHEVQLTAAVEFLLSSPRYLLQPERGPPHA